LISALDRPTLPPSLFRPPMAAVIPEPASEDLSVVLLGSFNPAIFHPAWLFRHGLLGEGTLETAAVMVVSKGVTEFEIGPVRLFCTDDRMVISVKNMAHAEVLHDIVAGILKLLPHVPVKAAGFNHETAFKISSVEHWHKIGHTLAPKDPIWDRICRSPGMALLTIKAPVEWECPLSENLSVQPMPSNNPKDPGVIVRANLHFDVPAADRSQSNSSTEWTTRFLEENWTRASCRARDVATTIFEQIPS